MTHSVTAGRMMMSIRDGHLREESLKPCFPACPVDRPPPPPCLRGPASISMAVLHICSFKGEIIRVTVKDAQVGVSSLMYIYMWQVRAALLSVSSAAFPSPAEDAGTSLGPGVE